MKISNFKTTLVALSVIGMHAASPTMSTAQKVAENGHVTTVVDKGASKAANALKVRVQDFYTGADLTAKINKIDSTIVSNDGVDMTKVNKYYKEAHKKARHNLPTGVLADLEKAPSWMTYNQVYPGLDQSKINRLKSALASRFNINKKSEILGFDSNQRKLITDALNENNKYSIMKKLKSKKVDVYCGNDTLVMDNKGQFSKATEQNRLPDSRVKKEQIKLNDYQLNQLYRNKETVSLQKLFPDGCSLNSQEKNFIGGENNTVFPLEPKQKALVMKLMQSRPIIK